MVEEATMEAAAVDIESLQHKRLEDLSDDELKNKIGKLIGIQQAIGDRLALIYGLLCDRHHE